VDRLESVLLLGEHISGNEADVYLTDDAVLRIDRYENDTFDERIAVLEAAQGRGYARLLDCDRAKRAMLLERLQPFDATFADVQRALQDAWEVRVDFPFRTAVDKARRLAQFIEEYWEHFGRPVPRAKVDRALELCESRAAAWDPDTAVVVHGDAHAHNVMRRANGELAFVDPEPFRCERAYDIAVALRMRPSADGQPEPVREWHFIERLSTGLQCLRLGYDELGRDLLDDP
jgi:streptomycin 6-kinase